MRFRISHALVALSLVFVWSPARAAIPVVNAFTTASSSNSPIGVIAFNATDSDGSVVGYMCTDSSTKPSASSPRWTPTPPETCTTSKNGSVTLYGWAKDNTNGVSNGKPFTTWVPGVHGHSIADIAGLQDALDAVPKRYANVVVVSADGNGDFLNPKAAIDAIIDASPTNPYLVKVLPGVYEVYGRINVGGDIDIEGSGENVTKIVNPGFPEDPLALALNADHIEVRDITVESSRSDQTGSTVALGIQGGSSPTLRNVRITATGAEVNYAIMIGGPAKPTFVSCDVTARGGVTAYGIFDAETGSRLHLRGGSVRAEGTTACSVFLRGMDSSVDLQEVAISSTMDGICLGGGHPFYDTNSAIVRNSTVGGDRYAVTLTAGGSNSLRAATSQFTAPILQNQSNVRLFQCFDQNFDPVQ